MWRTPPPSAAAPDPTGSADRAGSAGRAGSADQAGSAGRAGARRPRSVYGTGTEPDSRFSLANERTALAWVRTGLALVAGGVGLTALSAYAELPVLIDVLAILAYLAGGLLALGALVGWQRVERALRRDEPLPSPVALPVLTAGVALVALLLAAYTVYAAATHQ